MDKNFIRDGEALAEKQDAINVIAVRAIRFGVLDIIKIGKVK